MNEELDTQDCVNRWLDRHVDGQMDKINPAYPTYNVAV